MNGDVYSSLGVKRRINAAGTLTRLGGALMADEVIQAMAAASRSSIDIAELQAAASKTIAKVTGAEAGIVTTGAAAALTLAAAASMARWDIAKMAALPHTEAFPNEILLLRTHHTGYANALRAAGARLVDLGHNDRGTGAGVRGIEPWQIEAAITPRTVAFGFAANPSSVADLPVVVKVCKVHGIPVIVDAAAQLPPKSNLRRFFQEGADLVAFSGGKAIGGPQASGILAGRRDLVGSALVQQVDMDVAPETWRPPDLIDRAAMKGVPHHGLGRGFKAGKEEIIGLLTALERFASVDEDAFNARLEARLAEIASALGELPGVTKRIVPAAEGGRVARLHLGLDAGARSDDAYAISARLQSAETPVHLSERFAQQGVLIVDPQALRPEDDQLLATSLRRALLA